MKIERDYNPGPDWHERVIVVWSEDDAPVPDKERLHEAFARITGTRHHKEHATIDRGDWSLHLYDSGWVVSHYPEGSDVGFVYKVIEGPCDTCHVRKAIEVSRDYHERQYKLAKATLNEIREALSREV